MWLRVNTIDLSVSDDHHLTFVASTSETIKAGSPDNQRSRKTSAKGSGKSARGPQIRAGTVGSAKKELCGEGSLDFFN
jgi:hypothetical protein